MRAVLSRMVAGGRVALCGLVSRYNGSVRSRTQSEIANTHSSAP